jgi:hypothetical protein
MRISGTWAAGALLLLAACQPSTTDKPAAQAAAPPPMPKPQASVIELMAGTIAPTADIIWGAVGSVEGPKGPVDKKPTTEKDWAELRQKVVLLAEAANLLAIEGRAVIHPGQKLTNPAGPGDLTPEKAGEKIRTEWATWLGFTQVLQSSALSTLKAVDAKDLDGFVEAGGAIDEACEGCHKRFWYPDAPTPP